MSNDSIDQSYCSDYGAVNSIKLLEFNGVQFMLSGHDEGQLVIWKVHSTTNIGIWKISNPYQNILWCIDTSPKYVVTCSENSKILVYKTEAIFDRDQDTGRY